ncbi:hypothetical protein KIH39_12910 [Telmatocola sphagniphila]|uniref:Uncharacterized protein n=1 Tax=Telmatocola sphagniphila TaxID=1123043 RepID=A0A8E6BA93_9BACT|nr:hypothetical protein [Telmatocola sphagniphila]QVL34767.1 hypothetical protein KIH39_12910 [Telmatocola sphagniphila]
MASFYVLPPRALLQRQLRSIVSAYLPGARINEEVLLELFHNQADDQHFILHREDLPEGMAPLEALELFFGAEAGDQILQISSSGNIESPRVKALDTEKLVA